MYVSSKTIFVIFIAMSFFACLVNQSEAESDQRVNTFQDCAECPKMIVLSPGSFMMGSSLTDTKRDFAAVPHSPYDLDNVLWFWASDWKFAQKAVSAEHPQHVVSITKKFSIGEYPVTTREFAAFVRETGYLTAPCTIWSRPRASHTAGGAWSNPGFMPTDRDPVVCVSWNDANAYIKWLNGKVSSSATDSPYHLPSEAEWEYAARAGTRTARWWGEVIGIANAKCDGCGDPDRRRQPEPVGSFRANPFGLYDMLGNVWQFTEDCWHESYANAPLDGSPWRDNVRCTKVSFRGGSWDSVPWLLRSATRSGTNPDAAENDHGFRVAKSLP